MSLFDILKPNSKFVPAGQQPLDLPQVRHRGGKLPVFWIVLCGAGMVVFFGAGIWGMLRPKATEVPTFEPTLPNPAVVVEGSPTAFDNILTQQALLGSQTPTPTPSPTVTAFSLLTSTPSASPTVCVATHFLTQLVCDDLAMTATMQAVGVGTTVNVSGVDPKVTTIYIYATEPPTPWIWTASPTWTPVIITATPGPTQTPVVQVITATRGPTQTPWFFITQPPVVTVIWTAEVTREITRQVTVVVEVEVTREVVVTATATETPTPTPTETPTP